MPGVNRLVLLLRGEILEVEGAHVRPHFHCHIGLGRRSRRPRLRNFERVGELERRIEVDVERSSKLEERPVSIVPRDDELRATTPIATVRG
jgi:hypothetical protein